MIRGYKNLQKCGKDITSLRKPMNKKSKSNLKLERRAVSKLEVHFFVLLYFCTFVLFVLLYFLIWLDGAYELPCKIWSL